MTFDLSDYKVSPFTLIFIRNGDKVLFLRRSLTKQIFPGKISGVGGKIEPGETWKDSAIREALEETGLTIKDAHLKGIFIGIVPEKKYVNIIHLLLVDNFSGNLRIDPDEGELFWENPEVMVSNPDLVSHLKYYLSQVTSQDSDYYSGIGIVKNWELVEYTDNRTHFQNRNKNEK